MSNAQRIVIVGGGIAGLSTAWHLARLGAGEVVVVERERAVGTQATAQNAGLVRTAIGDASTRELALRGARFLNAPPAGFTASRLVAGDGLLLLSRRGEEWPDAERVDGERARRLMPALSGTQRHGWFFQDEGYVDVRALVAAFAQGAAAAGVRFVLGEGVRALRAGGYGVELARGAVLEADRCVLAAGAWAARLGRAAGSRVELTPTRRHLLVTRRDSAIDPRWPAVWSDDDEFYARPEAGGFMLCPCDEDVVDPDRLTVSNAALESVRAKARAVLVGEQVPPAARFWAGLRAHAFDRRFVIGPDADVAGLVWAAGLGGHGITCAAAVGELAASAALGQPLQVGSAAALAPVRFSQPPAAAAPRS